MAVSSRQETAWMWALTKQKTMAVNVCVVGVVVGGGGQGVYTHINASKVILITKSQ